MKYTISRLMLLFCVLPLSVPLHAGGVEGKVVFVQIGSGYTPDNVYALVKFDVAPNNQPSCATDPTNRFAINPATEAGKAMLSVLLTAKTTDATVEIIGTNDCNVMATRESVSYLRLT